MSSRALRQPGDAVPGAGGRIGPGLGCDGATIRALTDSTAPLSIAAPTDRALARRQPVLDAAADCFRRRGFHAASMAEIAKTAGMSPGHIDNLIENKEDIVLAEASRNPKLVAVVQQSQALVNQRRPRN